MGHRSLPEIASWPGRIRGVVGAGFKAEAEAKDKDKSNPGPDLDLEEGWRHFSPEDGPGNCQVAI